MRNRKHDRVKAGALLALLAWGVGCSGRSDGVENRVTNKESAAMRDSVPLTRPLSLSTDAGTQRWEFDVGPPGKNSGSSLILGFRMCLPSSDRAIAAREELFDAPPAVEIHLTSLSGVQPVEVPLTYIAARGHAPEPEFLQVPPSGEVESVRAASPDAMAMIEAGLDKEPSRCPVYAFARAMKIAPGRYALSLSPTRSYAQPNDAELELLVAYSYLGQ